MNNKQSIKKHRIKMYFLEAAKNIIIEEGVENVSVRKVADIAGYSYATLYNYFTDLNDLLWEVKVIMINNLVELLQSKMEQSLYDIEGIKKMFSMYISYYYENPNIFKFFFFHQQIKPSKVPGESVAEPNYTEMWQETFKGLIHEGKIYQKDLEVVAKTLIYAIHGMLTLSFSKNGNLTEANVYKDIEEMVDYILNKNVL